MLRGFLLTGAIVYAALLVIMYFGQRRLLYHPDQRRPELGALAPIGASEATLHTADGLSLLSWYLAPPDGAPVIVYLHGNGGNIGYRAERFMRFAAARFGVLMVEYRGYGGNPGRPSQTGLVADARAALAFLDAAGIAPNRHVLYGESLGSGVAVQLAVEYPIAALILEAPYTSIAAVAQYHYPFVPALRLVHDRFDSLAVIGRVEAPTLFLHAADDPVVPMRFGRVLYDAAPEPKEAWFMPQGGHEIGRYGGLDAAIGFLRRRLGASVLDHAAK